MSILLLVHPQVEDTGGKDDDNQTPIKAVSVQDVIPDNLIEQRLQRILESSGWFNSVEVQAEEGIVTLRGVSDATEHSEWASSVSRQTEGVIAVINKLEEDDALALSNSRNVIEASLNSLWKDVLRQSPLLAIALLILFLTALFSKLVQWIEQRIIENKHLRTSLKDLIYQLSSIGIWVIGILVALVVAFPGMTPAKALTTLGLGTVAIGFAFKDIFENFFAGILILWRYPFDRGDFITLEELTGKVEQITIRNTLIRKLDGELAVVPNAHIFKNNVEVLTSQPQRRVRLICGVAYGENVAEARDVIQQAVQSCSTVQGIRTVEVFAQEFADSSINFEVAWWTGSKPVEIRRSRDEVVTAIKLRLDQAGIEIPFPYRTLTFKNDEAFANLIDSQRVANVDNEES